MTLPLRHPLAVVAIFSLFVVSGVIAWPSLPVELLPSLKYPRLVVISSFGNASAEEVESLLTRPVEEAVGTVSGLRSTRSVSAEGISSVVLRFNWGSNMSLAAAEVREKLDLIADEFPRESKLPIVVQYDPTDTPIITLALTGAEDVASLFLIARNNLRTELETVNGVAGVRISGGLAPEIQVLVDRGRLVAFGMDLKLVADRLESANINFPGGHLLRDPFEFPVRTVGRFKKLAEISSVSLGLGKEGGTIQVKDVAEVIATHSDRTGLSRVNGQAAVLLGIIKEPTGNTVDVSRRVIARLDDLRLRIPAGTRLDVVDDEAPFIGSALQDLRTDIVWGSFLAFGVLLVFLRSLRSAGLIMLSIPVSVISTFAFMSFSGVSVNIMSIGGMALGVGMLVDCSIVVLEAIHRKRTHESDVFAAIVSALREVGPSVISGTLTTLVVLVPILFMTGMAQRLFHDFAFTMGGSLIMSLLVSVLLLPAIAVRIYAAKAESKAELAGMSFLESRYRSALGWVTLHPSWLVGTSAALFLASALGIYRLGFELLPKVDVGRFNINITLSAESSIEAVEKAVDRVEKWLQQLPSRVTYVVEAGSQRSKGALDPSQQIGKPNEARIAVKLIAGGEGPRGGGTAAQAIQQLRTQSESLGGAKVDFVLNQGPLARILGSLGNPEIMRLSGDDLEVLAKYADQLSEILNQIGSIKDLYWDGNLWTEQVKVVVDRYRAAAAGASVEEVAQAVRSAIEGRIAGKFIVGDQEQDIRVRLSSRERTTIEDLRNLPVRTTQERPALLGRIADIQTGKGTREILRADRQRHVVLQGSVVGMAASKGDEQALKVARSVSLPRGIEARPGAERFELTESLGSLATAIGLASMLVYVILVVQFESLIWPLVVFTAVPITIVGPAIALNLTGTPVNVLVLIGAVVLVGIVVNMAILMVATINDLRRNGLELKEAVIEGSVVRLRPILMTTLTTAFGALPICIFQGAADQLNRPLALTLVAGLLASAVFKLFVLPVIYQQVARTFIGRIS